MSTEESSGKLSTFGGVFTPSILTIFGLIMFMRANYVIGTAGIMHAGLILTLCCSITFLTGLSISAISTNTQVGGGGAYFLISRVLGPEFGTAIGIALFLAQAISVPFYILGFVEALISTGFVIDAFPTVSEHFVTISVLVLVGLFVMVWYGVDWIVKLQYGIFALLAMSILCFLAGAAINFDIENFNNNLNPNYSGKETVWTMFAIYFPAVTGIMAGVNLSGDLKDPSKSIPFGTLAAIIVCYVVYGIQIILCGGMTSSQMLIEKPYLSLIQFSIFGLGWLITAGVFCATLSSAIGSNLGAPRVLQAVGKDQALRILTPFAKGTAKNNEPRRALVFTFLIGFITLTLAGSIGNAGLNVVAEIVSMVFLYTYGMTNLAAFVESSGANPSFRPRFKYFSWLTALIGTVACIFTAFMINAIAALCALLFICALFYVVRNSKLRASYGDARRGFVYSRVSNNLIKLNNMPADPKNWRPTILVFSANPYSRINMVGFARWLGKDSGIVSLVYIMIGDLQELAEKRREESRRLQQFTTENNLNIFSEAIVMRNFDDDLPLFLQSYSIGPIKPNIILMGWNPKTSRIREYYKHLRTIQQLEKSIIVLTGDTSIIRNPKRIDIWWRGQQNGSLMMILAYLILANQEWKNARIRVLRLLNDQADMQEANKELQQIISLARMNAIITTPISTAPFAEILRSHSSDADLVMLGLTPPNEEIEEKFHEGTSKMLEGMPPAMLVYSSGEADLNA
ncbi:MAG: amino acid permease [Lentisphaeria bacterium]|nr:amino acid permease [Lentisphaeria bacterium]